MSATVDDVKIDSSEEGVPTCIVCGGIATHLAWVMLAHILPPSRDAEDRNRWTRTKEGRGVNVVRAAWCDDSDCLKDMHGTSLIEDGKLTSWTPAEGDSDD